MFLRNFLRIWSLRFVSCWCFVFVFPFWFRLRYNSWGAAAPRTPRARLEGLCPARPPRVEIRHIKDSKSYTLFLRLRLSNQWLLLNKLRYGWVAGVSCCCHLVFTLCRFVFWWKRSLVFFLFYWGLSPAYFFVGAVARIPPPSRRRFPVMGPLPLQTLPEHIRKPTTEKLNITKTRKFDFSDRHTFNTYQPPTTPTHNVGAETHHIDHASMDSAVAHSHKRHPPNRTRRAMDIIYKLTANNRHYSTIIEPVHCGNHEEWYAIAIN